MTEGDVAAYHQAHALFVAIPLILVAIAYIIYRIRKEHRRRLRRNELEQTNPEIYEKSWYENR